MAKQQKRADAARMYAYSAEDFNTFYPMVFICCAMLAIGAVFAVLFWDIAAGAVMFITACIAYWAIISWKLWNDFGVRYKSEGGALCVTKIVCLSKDCIVVPSKLMWSRFETIDDGAFDFDENKKVKTVYIPLTVTYIGEQELLPKLEILYEGNREEWERVEKKVQIPRERVTFLARYPSVAGKTSGGRK